MGKAKAKEKADIARLDDWDREKSKVEARGRARKNANVVNRAAEEAAAIFRFIAEIQGAKRERAEA